MNTTKENRLPRLADEKGTPEIDFSESTDFQQMSQGNLMGEKKVFLTNGAGNTEYSHV